MKKLLVVGVIVLFLGLAIAPSINANVKQITMPTAKGDTLYVGGNGTGNYSTIQDAIDNASDGDTVYVFSGTYVENLEIEKTIKLIGEYKNTTLIDGSIKLYYYASGIKVNGFTINNSIALEYSHNHTISNNIFIFGSIKTRYSFHNTISNNTLQKGNIFLKESRTNKIINNTLTSNGIRIDRIRRLDECNSHIIENNTLDGRPIRYYKNANDIIVPHNTAQLILANCKNFTIMNLNISNIDFAIQLFASKNNIISNNYIGDINKNTGVYLGDSRNNVLSHNTINNKRNGIHCEVSGYNTITENNIYNNSIGIFAFDSPCISIKNNSILNNGVGIAFSLGSATIDGNNISNNVNGISFFDTAWSVISNNSITYNTGFGIKLYSVFLGLDGCNNNVIQKNNFIGNDCNAYFENALFTRWKSNYWQRAGTFSYVIFGKLEIRIQFEYKTFTWINIDWHPAQEPYDIGV